MHLQFGNTLTANIRQSEEVFLPCAQGMPLQSRPKLVQSLYLRALLQQFIRVKAKAGEQIWWTTGKLRLQRRAPM